MFRVGLLFQKPLSPKHRSTFLPLQHTATLISSVDWGLSGSIPSELGNLANLDTLSLYENQLSESIPSELGNLDNLEYLYLGGNQLSGCVPTKLLDVPSNDGASLGLPSC